METFKGAGINPLSYIHYTEHLAPVCVIMDMPLVLGDQTHYDMACRYYPGLNAHLVPYEEFTPSYILDHYNVLFRSDIWDKEDLQARFTDLARYRGRTMRSVHCPHGFSDKVFWFRLVAKEDITLVYGQNMLDMLSEAKVQVPQHVLTGNHRYSYYKAFKSSFDSIVHRDVFSQFPKKQPLILYAPTWYDTEKSTSFFDATQTIVEELPDHYNLLIKLHPHLEDYDIVEYYRLISTYGNKPNVVFLEQYPLIYPLLAQADIYIGDMSSIGYDFLSFNRPMFFLNQNDRNPATDRGLYLFRCGTVINREDYSAIHQIIFDALKRDKETFGKIREETYHYTFGEERPFQDIRRDIMEACGFTIPTQTA